MNEKGQSEAMAAAVSARSVEELESQYAKWAADYDAENAAAGFRLPALATSLVARYVPVSDEPILDAGCGTELAGDNLRILGYWNLVGIDLSEPMLALAKRRGIYSSLHRMVLGEPLDFRDIATVASGVFTEGHAPHSSFDELIRVTKAGGHLIFSVRDDIYEKHGFWERQESLEAAHRWKLIETSERFRSFTIKEPHIFARLFVYEGL